MRRVLVVGQSGAGKTTAARRLAAALGVPHVELDALFHGPGWLPRPEFVDDVDRASSGPAWVADGNYRPVRDVLWARADNLVWLDLPRLTTTRRALRRSLRRMLARTRLWHGEPEPLLSLLRPSHPVRWSWQTHARHRAEYDERLADPRWDHLQVVRLRSVRQVRAWLDGRCGEGGPA